MANLVTVEANAILDLTSGYASTVTTAATTTGAITSLSITGTNFPASSGTTDVLLITDGTHYQVFNASASWTAAATSITLTSVTPTFNFPIGSAVYDLTLTSSYKLPIGPIKVALNTAVGSASAAGTETAGGSYARQPLYMSVAAAESITSNTALTYTNMPAATITSIDEFDSAGTPIRRWWGNLSASKTTNAGDTFSIASSSYSKSLS
jgi:hypothetical protein